MNSLRSAFTSLADRILQQTKEQKNPNDDTLKKIHDEVRELKDQFALMSQENLKLTKQNEDLEQTNKQLRGELEESQHALDALKRAQNEKKLEPKLLLVDQTTQVGPEDLPKNNTLISDEDGFEVVNVEELADKSLGNSLTFLRAEVLTGSDSANLPEVPNDKVETPQTLWEDAITTLLLNAKRTSEWRHSNKALPDQPTYTFRANIVDLADDSRRLASVRSPLPTMAFSELLARLVAEGALSEGEAAASTVALASSGLVAEASQALPHTSQVAIYLPGEAAGATKVRVSVAGREFCFVLDARVSQVMGVLASELPEVRGAAVWWSGVDISDEVFSEARLGHLCSAEGVWSPMLTTALLGTFAEGDLPAGPAEVEAPGADSEAVDFFDDDESEASAASSSASRLDFSVESFADLPTRVLLNFGAESEQEFCFHPSKVPLSDSTEHVAQSLLPFLCLLFSMPIALVAPCIRAGNVPVHGTITVVVYNPSEPDGYVEVFVNPLRHFQITLPEHFTLYPLVQQVEHTVRLFSPAADPLLPPLSRDRSISQRVAELVSAAHPEVFFDTRAAEEANEDGSPEAFFHIFLSTQAAAVEGLPVMTTVPPYATGKAIAVNSG